MPQTSHKPTVALLAAAAVALAAAGDDEALSYAGLKRSLRRAVDRDPIDALFGTVLVGAYLFYRAEHGKNPKVARYWDALTFIATSLSVGYDNTFPETPAGEAIASLVMILGPSMAASALDPPASEKTDATAAITQRLDAILEELRSSRAAALT
jgi:hypothetical protein